MITREILEQYKQDVLDEYGVNDTSLFSDEQCGMIMMIDRLLLIVNMGDNPHLTLQLAKDMVTSELLRVEESYMPKLKAHADLHPVLTEAAQQGFIKFLHEVPEINTFNQLDILVRIIWHMGLQEWLDSVPWLTPDR